jgi:acetolactate synthase-1/2/3 large subunit
MKYAEVVVDWLKGMGYTHCFFVAGGNCMHLLDAVRSRMTCIPVVHEVAGGIAAEYFNEAQDDRKAFVVITAGPGVTNIVTAIGGAYLESRELLILGGQVKSSDLADGGLRQRGIQEICGIDIVKDICKTTAQVTAPIPRAEFEALVESGWTGRPGPVFIEMCLDAQGAPVDPAALEGGTTPVLDPPSPRQVSGDEAAAAIAEAIEGSERPIVLIGGGVSRETAAAVRPALREMGIPLQTTWNGADRLGVDEPLYVGRPNTWGQRGANLVLAQSDCIVALGSRLGLQQTGFNWQEFAPVGRVVQVDIDPAELDKGHPVVDVPLVADTNDTLRALSTHRFGDYSEWLAYAREVAALPLDDPSNETAPGYISPYSFVEDLSGLCTPDDVIIPCSSGGANSVMMQALLQKEGQIVITDKGLASMGYGLSGAIGASLALPDRRTVLVEGDGGFAQNLQELATVRVNDLNLKIFIFANEGYASIRSTQRNYFDGAYLGCDTRTGLGFPDWLNLFGAFGIPGMDLSEGWAGNARFTELWESDEPAAFVVPVDPEQTYLPKISSRVRPDGGMESNPLHNMSPELEPDVAARVMRYLG